MIIEGYNESNPIFPYFKPDLYAITEHEESRRPLPEDMPSAERTPGIMNNLDSPFFTEPAAVDNLYELLRELKKGLLYCPDESFDSDYRRIRKILVSHPALRKHVPEFLRHCHDVGDYLAFMSKQFQERNDWDDYLRRGIMELQAAIEDTTIGIEDFELGTPIGRGGFGIVYKARHRLLERDFAIKVFHPSFSEGGRSLARFFQEARMLFDLNHPSIIRVHNVGMVVKRPFIVMELFDGTDLNASLKENGAMPPSKAIALIRMVLEGVQHAHACGIIHRDLRPSNILIGHPKKCRVIDFGLGVYVEQRLESRLTSGTGVGGDQFTAPELLANPRLVDKRSDIYSIGAIWYAAVTNRPPVGNSLADALAQVEGLSEPHQKIITKCLNDAPARYYSCKEVIRDIDEIEKGKEA